MPEGRMIKKIISTSLKIAKLKSDSARLLYTWLIPHLDIEGRFSADPYIVKGYIVPRLKMSSRKISEYLEDMANNDLIVLYEINGDKFLQLNKFKDFQILRENRESKSLIPALTPGLLRDYSSTSKVKESKVKESKVNVDKTTYAEFVLMTPEEHKKLIEKYGEANTKKFIEKLNNTKGANKKLKYDSDYFAILKWVVEAVIGEDKKKELERRYQEGIKKEKEWGKNKDRREEPIKIRSEETKKETYEILKNVIPKFRDKLKNITKE